MFYLFAHFYMANFILKQTVSEGTAFSWVQLSWSYKCLACLAGCVFQAHSRHSINPLQGYCQGQLCFIGSAPMSILMSCEWGIPPFQIVLRQTNHWLQCSCGILSHWRTKQMLLLPSQDSHLKTLLHLELFLSLVYRWWETFWGHGSSLFARILGDWQVMLLQ